MDIKSVTSELKNIESLSQTREIGHSKEPYAPVDKSKDEKSKNKLTENKFNEENLKSMVKNINSYVNLINRKVQFKIMRDFDNQTVIQVVDIEKDDVIRQIPPEYLLRLEKTLAELTGLITDETA